MQYFKINNEKTSCFLTLFKNNGNESNEIKNSFFYKKLILLRLKKIESNFQVNRSNEDDNLNCVWLKFALHLITVHFLNYKLDGLSSFLRV